MSELITQINTEKLPKHIAVIMDGNGRWAKGRNMPRVFGHRNGVKAVRETSEAAAEIGIDYLTLYAFSTENWKRPTTEVSALMSLLVDTIHKETETMNKNNIRLQAIGDLSMLPNQSYDALLQGIEDTKNNTRMTMVLALNYSARWEISNAMTRIARGIEMGEFTSDQIQEDLIQNHLTTRGIPDPELMIRTSGEHRISNFLLWQMAYTELYFTDILWPDFRRDHFYQAIIDFQRRERRFGKISEQLA